MESHTDKNQQAETFVIDQEFYDYCMNTPMSYLAEAADRIKNNRFFFDHSGSGRNVNQCFPVDEYREERNGAFLGRPPTRQECMSSAFRFVNDHILGHSFERMEYFDLRRMFGQVINSLQLVLGFDNEEKLTRLIPLELLEAILSANGAGLSIREFKILLSQFFREPIAFFQQDKHRQLVQAFFDVNLDIQLLKEKFSRVNTSYSAIDDARNNLAVMMNELNSTYTNASSLIEEIKNDVDSIHYEEYCQLRRIAQTIRDGIKQIKAYGTLDRSVTTLGQQIDFRHRQNGQFRVYHSLLGYLTKDLDKILFDMNGFLLYSKMVTREVSILTRSYDIFSMQWTVRKFCQFSQQREVYGITANKIVMPPQQVRPSQNSLGRISLPKKKTIASFGSIKKRRQRRLNKVADNKQRVDSFNYAMHRVLDFLPPVRAMHAKRCNAKRPWETPRLKVVFKVQRSQQGKFVVSRQYKEQQQRILFKRTKVIRKQNKEVRFEKIKTQRAPRSKEQVQQIFIVERAARREQIREERKSDWEKLGFASEIDFMMIAEEDRRLYRKFLEEEDPRLQEHFADQIVLRSLFKRL